MAMPSRFKRCTDGTMSRLGVMITPNVELDSLDTLAASAFDSYLVRKDAVRCFTRQYSIPTYVVRFLLQRLSILFFSLEKLDMADRLLADAANEEEAQELENPFQGKYS